MKLARVSSITPWLQGASIVLGLVVTAAAWAQMPTLNDKVVKFAKDHLGQKVGNGECSALAAAALNDAGAKRFPYTEDGDFVWGTQLESAKEAKPGDILQFRDAVFKGRGRLPDGRRGSWRSSYPHHTAIVARTKAGGKILDILHQNIQVDDKDESLKQTVQQATINLSELQPGGWVRAYRPIARAEDEDRAFDAETQPTPAPERDK